MNWDRFNKTYLILSHAQVFKAKGMNDYFMVKTHTKLYIVKKHIYNFKKFKKSIFHHFPSFKLQRCVLFFIFMFLYFIFWHPQLLKNFLAFYDKRFRPHQ